MILPLAPKFDCVYPREPFRALNSRLTIDHSVLANYLLTMRKGSGEGPNSCANVNGSMKTRLILATRHQGRGIDVKERSRRSDVLESSKKNW